jgi:hypothetical protein
MRVVGGFVVVAARMRVLTVPASDAEFAAAVDHALALALLEPDGSKAVVAELVHRLLPRYPRLALHEQDGLASFDRDVLTWYAYRDGFGAGRNGHASSQGR